MSAFRPTEAPPLYSQDGKGYSAVCYAHYFIGSSDWLVTEYDPEEGIAFGWACLNGDRQMAELGYVDMGELESIELMGFQKVERESGWEPVSLTEAIALLDERFGVGEAE